MKDIGTESFELRQLGEDDFEEFEALLRYAFQVSTSEMARIGWSDMEMKQSKMPIFEASYVMGWFYKGHLASQIVIYPMEVNIQGEICKMGGVTGVATYPEYTGRGLIHSLIGKSLEYMRSQQQIVSYLCPYSIPLYRKHGWEIVSDKMTFSIKDTQLPKRHAVEGQIERVDIECEDLHRVYKYFALQEHGALVRSKLEWEEYWRWDSDDVMAAVYYSADAKPLGYVIYYIENEVFSIKEMVYLNQEAKYGIWNYISAHFSMITKVEGANYTGEPIAFQFEDSEIDESIQPYAMARIVDVQRFIEQYTFQFEDPKLNLELEVSDVMAPWNNGIFHVSWRDGRTLCEKVNNWSTGHRLSLDIKTLTTMLMGYKRPTYLYNNDRIDMDYHLLKTLETLISPDKPYFSDYF
ncbi:GNAT family N-acetyltransferase [Desulfovibrio desulfuricans]|uniref:GNAT family N-acetyltransferase n=1 Tax=Desulfovibrio desulfuricans TaxID=876 RepID=A0A4P7UG88_DESDE|nr:GNAT family N-acetyltransferase [Desulfovibrio desulfuricans]